jgi:hypothetical protein
MSYRFGRKPSAVKRVALVLSLITLAMLGWMYHVATSDPVVRTTSVMLSGLSEPLRLVLISDIHVAGPDMVPTRVTRIVSEINALHPDLVLIAGDLVSDKSVATHRYSVAEAVGPLARLKARFGAVAVLGNHDHWRNADETRRELRRAGIRVLDNDATRIGALTIIGVDDPFTGNDNLRQALERAQPIGGPRILLSHSPDIFPQVPADVPLTLAGHTHCGQIRLPLIGALSTLSAYGDRYACGRVDEGGRILVVSAGLGTSLLPLRLGAVPDLWLIELRPA